MKFLIFCFLISYINSFDKFEPSFKIYKSSRYDAGLIYGIGENVCLSNLEHRIIELAFYESVKAYQILRNL